LAETLRGHRYSKLMIALKHVSKYYDSTTALHPLDLTIAPEATTVLIGPSGCGKSTLLRLMIGLILPDTGTVTFGGEHVTTHNLTALRHQMGYVTQDGGLFPHLTAYDNLALVARHLGWNSARIETRVQELATLVQLPAKRLGSYPTQLSGGQRQRVSLMRALMLDPKVLLLDEPLGALDPMIRADLQADLRDIFRKLQKTVVIVTHDMGEAGFFGDTILLLRDGQIVQQGTLQELLDEPAEPFVEAFINAQRSPLALAREDG
jgi:osmoprotectant transport system ATP-binding protein